MADESINLVLSSQVASRFVSSTDLETAKLKREAEWKAAYERLGQEPPPMPQEEYDGRSLYEKLKETKDKKQMAFEEKLKFKNQFRALDDEEVAFLDDAAEEKRAEAMAKEAEIQKEMERFKKAIAHRTGEAPLIGSAATAEVSNEKPVVASGTSKVAVTSGITTTTMIPKKTRKAKDFQRSFLAGAIRPKSTNNEGPSTTKKRKISNPAKDSSKSSAENPIENSSTAPTKSSEGLDDGSSEPKNI